MLLLVLKLKLSIELLLTDWYEHVLTTLEDLLLKRLIDLNLKHQIFNLTVLDI